MIVCENEEENLETSACILPRQNNVYTADAAFYENGGKNIQQRDSLVQSLNKMRNILFHHDRHYTRCLRQTRVICDVIQMINSDFGLQILLIIAYVFISFVIFTFFAMDAEYGLSVTM